MKTDNWHLRGIRPCFDSESEQTEYNLPPIKYCERGEEGDAKPSSQSGLVAPVVSHSEC